jgi:3-hydroxy-9,10-secoandrosta-1,3,5(10)-triene-9,17-dione monooxygenase reductase component
MSSSPQPVHDLPVPPAPAVKDPGVFDVRAFRNILGSFPTGVTVITTLGEGDVPVGLTANSFNSLSLDPPLILWSLYRKSPSLVCFEKCPNFAINILAQGQSPLSQRFAKPIPDKFAGVDWKPGHSGMPVLGGCAAVLECTTVSMQEAGDHVLFIGRVDRFEGLSHAPLAFHAGKYRLLGDHIE